jgi:hypothetical protein
MTPNNDFERHLGAWLRQDSEHRVPDHLETILARTVATRQRPWWSSLRRWLPFDVTLPRAPFSRSGSWRPILAFVIVTLLVATLLLLAVGSRRHLPPPFGLARNGIVITAVNGDLFSVDPKTLAKTPLVSDSPDEWTLAQGSRETGRRSRTSDRSLAASSWSWQTPTEVTPTRSPRSWRPSIKPIGRPMDRGASSCHAS